MAQPIVKSYDQLLGEALAAYMAKIGVTDINTGSAVMSFFEANAQMTYRATGDVFQILRDFSIDRATGDSLKNLAIEEGVTLRPASVATGTVSITDTSFQKLSSKVYAGTKSPNIGSTSINVGNALGWPASGQIYIGRNTPNIEGPISYTSITPIGSYYQINLATPTLKYHNVSESVIVAQGGNRLIPSNTVVQTPSIGGSAPVLFFTTDAYTLLDGETQIVNIPVVAQTPGVEGNVPANSITEFVIPPFTGASVNNTSPFVTGRDNEDDESLKTRIKQTRQSRGLGTATAIETYTLGAQASDEPATVTSNKVIKAGGKTTLFVDDNTGYERKTDGVGLEYIVDSALGGENAFQLATGGSQAGISKAFLTANISEPYSVSSGDKLAVLVGGTLSEHTFGANDIQANGSATAYEIVTSINSNSSLLFQATTSESGTKVVLVAKEEENSYIQISSPSFGVNSAPAFNFPSDEIQTLRLYKNDLPLSEYGRSAFVNTEIQSAWSNAISSGDTLTLSVDSTPAITYTFTDQDFVDNTEFVFVSNANTLSSWVAVINAKVTGVTASIDGQTIRLTSNLGISSRAKIEIDPASTLVAKNMFSTAAGLSAEGVTKDFEFSRNTGQIKLVQPLVYGDKLTAGTTNNYASVKTGGLVGATVTIANPANIWVLIDDADAESVGVTLSAGDTISVTKTVNTITYTASKPSFHKVSAGDYVIIWSQDLSAPNRIEGRILNKTVTHDAFTVEVTAAEASAAVVESVTYNAGIAFVKSKAAPQRLTIPASTYNINDLALQLNQDLVGASFSVEDDLIMVLKSNTSIQDKGSVLIASFDTAAQPLLLTAGDKSVSRLSHVAVYEAPADAGSYPYFAHTGFSTESSANPSASYISSITSDVDFEALGLEPNFLLSMVQKKYPFDKDAQPANEMVQVENLNSNVVDLNSSEFIKRIRSSDYAFAARPYSFGHNDSLVVVLDNDPVNKTFIIPFYRRLKTNTTLANNATSFNAYDVDFGPTGNLITSFGPSFDFNNYKALMRAKVILDNPNTADSSILIRSSVWGKSGEYYKVGYYYPTNASQGISHTVSVGQDVDIKIFLSSGTPIVTAIDGTTEWDVTVTNNTPAPGIEQVTYTWNGTGTPPALPISGGEYVTIAETGLFSKENTGSFKVSTEPGFLPTASSFSVARPSGSAVVESGVATIVPNTIRFFNTGADTALDIVTYINDNLISFIEAELIDDSGLTGAGVVDISTLDATNFVDSQIYLKDGENWILSSNPSASPQFTFKRNLSYIADGSYTFNNGEEIRLTPTTPKQVVDFISTLAVSGFTTLGTITDTRKEKRFEIGTSILGSEGAVQIAGGSANISTMDAVGSSLSIDNAYAKTFVSTSQAQTIISGQLIEINASNLQEKQTDLSPSNTYEITPNTPSVGRFKLTIGNRGIQERLFNRPRISPVVGGVTFKVERHGQFTCIRASNGAASFSSSVNFDITAGDKVSFYKIPLTSYVDMKIDQNSVANFQEVDFGSVVQVSGHGQNDGAHLVVGKSQDGKSLRLLNVNGASSAVSSLITITDNANLSGDSFVVAGVPKLEGTHWAVGVDANATATNLALALSSIPNINAVASLNTVLVQAVAQDTPITLAYNNTGPSGATISASYLEGSPLSISDLAATKEVREGDTVFVGSDFAVLNQGKFRVVRRFLDSIYIENDKSVEEEVTLSSTDILVGPAPVSFTITKIGTNGNATVQAASWDLTGIKVGHTANVSGFSTPSNNGSFTVIGVGSDYIEIANAAAVNEVGAASVSIYEPSLMFFDYNTPVKNDTLVLSGDFFGANQGQYIVSEVLDQNNMILEGSVSVVAPTILSSNSDNIFIQEEIPYKGYKEVLFIAAEPSNPNISTIVFSTVDNYEKINEAADTVLTSTAKPKFPSDNRVGVDAYRFDTGLLAEVNKIVYGDPRDRSTYPGVSAAGAEIYIDPPLRRRVSLGIVVRLQTGVPLAQVIEQVRNSVAALIQSNPIGNSIAISNIVSVVDEIPGVRAVSISSPLYDQLNDIIIIQPSEKSVIINPVSDISVTQVGT